MKMESVCPAHSPDTLCLRKIKIFSPLKTRLVNCSLCEEITFAEAGVTHGHEKETQYEGLQAMHTVPSAWDTKYNHYPQLF
jgi:hypothetical protein